MHETQKKLLALARKKNIAQIPLRTLGKEIGIGENARLVQHHIDQLMKKGFLWIDRQAGEMKLLKQTETTIGKDNNFIRIPIVGAASCGIASQIAEEGIEGYVTLSPSLLKLSKHKNYYALRAVGDSMDKASVPSFEDEKGIEENDLVIVEADYAQPADGDIVVSVIDGLANIKKFKKRSGVIELISESKQKYLPIYIDPTQEEYIVSGKVKGVIKS